MKRLDRRDFMKASAGVSVAAVASQFNKAYAAGSDKIRIGTIGCGGRGNYDTSKCLEADDNIELVAMGDLFGDRVGGLYNSLKGRFADKVNVPTERRFTGWDAYKKVLACDIDLVINTQAPHFRPMHVRAAIEAGKHVFMEKPVAVDPVGVRSIIESSEMADQKGLTIVAGTQMRRIPHLVAGIEKLHQGAIGDLVSGQCVRLGDGMMGWGVQQRDPNWSDMEWQIRRWLFYTWLSGDFITEMHVHNLDIVNWAMGSHPVSCMGLGGRQVRTDPRYADSYDHFAVEYEYPNGVRIEYMGCQIDKVNTRNDQRFVGTKGSAYMDFANSIFTTAQGEWRYDGERYDPCVRQHADQLDAIRTGKKLNEGRRIAESTLTAIMGRMSAYTGRALKWDWALKASKLDLSPEKYEFGPLPDPVVAMPGKTQII
ncbi:MAG: Gfo/Idh/MocA family oxidoreductase [Sedimentisphaerales bacterium]|nr:Gfo/Idh/MocA family oxidoreductase [Sedimentisphaerales bacterium]